MHHHKAFYSCLSTLVVEVVASVQALKKEEHNFLFCCTTEKRSLKEERRRGGGRERGRGERENSLGENSRFSLAQGISLVPFISLGREVRQPSLFQKSKEHTPSTPSLTDSVNDTYRLYQYQ